MPSADAIERCLRDIVRSNVAQNEVLSVNSARAAAESQLGLEDGFFKQDEQWKIKSKEIITSAVADETDNSSPPPALEKPLKRSSDSNERTSTAKRQKQTEEEDSDGPSASPLTLAPAKNTRCAQSSEDLSPDEGLIKTLQSQLLKCGVRRLWHRELAHCDTNKEKIKHLRSMLVDVGMTGRFSLQKAKQIKEARELAADLEATKEFEKSWGSEARSARAARSKAQSTAKRRSTRDESDDENHDESGLDQDQPPITAGVATGLVDFGDSGDDGSD